MPRANGTAGMKAEPSCSLHAIGPTLATARFAQKPRKIPKAVHIDQVMTNAPLRLVLTLFTATTILRTRELPDLRWSVFRSEHWRG